MEKPIGRTICSKTRRTRRDKLLPKNGTIPTRASKPLFQRRGHASINSGRQLRGSTTFTAIGTCSVPVPRSKNSANLKLRRRARVRDRRDLEQGARRNRSFRRKLRSLARYFRIGRYLPRDGSVAARQCALTNTAS